MTVRVCCDVQGPHFDDFPSEAFSFCSFVISTFDDFLLVCLFKKRAFLSSLFLGF